MVDYIREFELTISDETGHVFKLNPDPVKSISKKLVCDMILAGLKQAYEQAVDYCRKSLNS